MKDVILLTKILFKSSISNKNNGNKIFGKILIFGFAYLYLAGIVGYISYEAITSLKIIHQEVIFLELCFLVMIGLSFIQTIFNALNILFFSKDIEYLLPLPVAPIKIIMSKFNCLIITQYIMSLIIILPVLVVYGYLLSVNVMFYFIGIIVMLLFPVVPVILVSILVTLIMKITNIIKNKEVVQYLTVVITLVLILVIQLFISNTNNEITQEEFANILIQANSIEKIISNYFITLKSASNALLNYNNLQGFLSLGSLFLETIFIYFLGAFITSKMYIKAVTKIVSSGIRKTKNLKKNFKENKIYKSYVKKEFINLTRNPIFFMQCVLPSILFPILFSLPIMLSIKDISMEEMMDTINIISHVIETPLGLLVSLAIVTFMFIFNFIALTCVSRDRNNAIFMKYIPISLEKQCLYKISPGIILNMLPIIYFIILLKIFIPIISMKMLLYIIINAILINICNNYIMIIIDLKNPKLEWITEYTVVKQNFNMIFQMIIILTEVIIIALICLNISNLDFLAIIIGTLYVFSIVLIQKYIKENQKKLFSNII